MALSMQEKQHALERGCSSIPPCPEERERNHAPGVLCHDRIQPSVCSLLTAYVCKARDPGSSDSGPPSPLVQGEGCFPTRPSPWPRQRKHRYGPAVVEALVWMYHLAGELCGKRLEAAMPELLRAIARHGTVVPDPLPAALLQMGSATMDRLLRAEKTKGGNRRHAPRTKPGSLLRLIPIVSSRELSAAAPGQVEWTW